MLRAVSQKNSVQHGGLLTGQHRLRYQEFIERQDYDVKTLEDLEFDEYDTLAAVYLVYSEDGETVLGASRLTPIHYGCMLADHFPHLVDDHSVFAAPRTWEGTRFCIDKHLPADKRLHILRAIVAGYLEFALHNNVSRIIGLMPTLILRSVFERSGVELDRLGAAYEIGQHAKIQAASIAVTREQLKRVEAKTGVANVLGYQTEEVEQLYAAE